MDYGVYKQRFLEANCSMCPDLVKSRKQILFDRGEGKKILFIGDVPTKEDNEAGELFKGKEGKWLDNFIQKLELNKQDFVMTTAVKCFSYPRQLNERTGTHVKNCSDKLHWQLALLKPTLVVLLGSVATDLFAPYLSDVSMSAKSGISFFHPDYDDSLFYIMPDPKYFLTNSNTERKKEGFIRDLKIIVRSRLCQNV